jgi:hypothetical protein
MWHHVDERSPIIQCQIVEADAPEKQLRGRRLLSNYSPMRIPKLVVLGSAMVFGTLGSFQLHAQTQRDDSDLQAKARDELRRKMSELDSAPTTSTTAPALTPAPVAPAKTPPPMKMKTAPPPPMETPRPQPVMNTAPVLAQASPPQVAPSQIYIQQPNPDRDKAEQMLRQKMAELDAQQAASQPPPKGSVRPMTMTPPPVTAPPVATPPASDDAKARAEADEVAKTETRLKAKADAKAKREAEARAKQDAKFNPQAATFPVATQPPPSTPPPAMSATMTAKDQRLEALLQQYRADQITPQQYHEQRAKILAEP